MEVELDHLHRSLPNFNYSVILLVQSSSCIVRICCLISVESHMFTLVGQCKSHGSTADIPSKPRWLSLLTYKAVPFILLPLQWPFISFICKASNDPTKWTGLQNINLVKISLFSELLKVGTLHFFKDLYRRHKDLCSVLR